MTWQLTHHIDRAVELAFEGVALMRYAYLPGMPDDESPRPIVHPLRSLKGHLLTGHRPTDHPWHRGVSLTSAHLSGANFWGGPTYVRGAGYTHRRDHGRQAHRGWDEMRHDDAGVTLAHRLDWEGPEREAWIEEARRLEASALPDGRGWALRWSSTLRNVAGRKLEFGSPTTEGREKAGYGGLFWRGPRDFADGEITTPEGPSTDEAMMGRSAPWLAYTGHHDDSLDHTTLVFVDHADNPRHPGPWFVRSGVTPMVCFAWAFDEVYPLPAGETLSLRYALIFAEGDAGHARPAELAASAFA